MHSRSIVLATVTTLLVSCGINSARVASEQTMLSKMTPPDVVRPVDHIKATRFLRNEIDDDDLDSGDEERGSAWKKAEEALMTRIRDTHGAEAKIVHWKEQEFSPETVKQLLKQAGVSEDGTEWKAYKLYIEEHMLRNHRVN